MNKVGIKQILGTSFEVTLNVTLALFLIIAAICLIICASKIIIILIRCLHSDIWSIRHTISKRRRQQELQSFIPKKNNKQIKEKLEINEEQMEKQRKDESKGEIQEKVNGKAKGESKGEIKGQSQEENREEKLMKEEEIEKDKDLRKITIGDLHNVREGLRQAFYKDQFLILEEPITVVTSGIKIIKCLGGVSAWVLTQSRRRLRHHQNQGRQSDSETQTQSNPEAMDDDYFKREIVKIMKAEKKRMENDEKQRALNLYNIVSEKFSCFSVTVIIAKGRWKGIWNSYVDCIYKCAQQNVDILILLN